MGDDREAFIPAGPVPPLVLACGRCDAVLECGNGNEWWCEQHGRTATMPEWDGQYFLAIPGLAHLADVLHMIADSLTGPPNISTGPPRNPTPPVGAGLPLRRVTDSPQA